MYDPESGCQCSLREGALVNISGIPIKVEAMVGAKS